MSAAPLSAAVGGAKSSGRSIPPGRDTISDWKLLIASARCRL